MTVEAGRSLSARSACWADGHLGGCLARYFWYVGHTRGPAGGTAHLGSRQLAPMIVLIAGLAGVTPLVVVMPLRDPVVLPKLVTTATFTSCALAWGAYLLVRGEVPLSGWPRAIWLAAVAFVAANLLSLLFAYDRRWSLMGEDLRYQGLLTVLLYVLLFGLAAATIRSRSHLRWLLLGLFVGGVGSAIYALIQKAGLDWVTWPGRDPDRPAATLGQANAFGAYLVAVISASAVLLFTSRARWQRAVLGLGLLVMFLALLFSLSRSAYIAMLAVVIIWAIAGVRNARGHVRWRTKPPVRSIAAVILPIAIASLALLALPQGRAELGRMADRLRGSGEINSQSVGGRFSLWLLAARMTKDRPLFGYGQDAFTLKFGEYRDRPDLPGIGTANIAPESAHNFFLDLASGTGVIGLGSFIALVSAVFWHGSQRARAAQDWLRTTELVALSAGAGGYLVAIFFGFSEAMTSWVFWLLLGAVVGQQTDAPAIASKAPSFWVWTSSQRMLAAALTLIVVLAVLGWAFRMTAGDLAAGQVIRASQHGEYEAAARLAGRAAMLNPLRREYLLLEGRAYQDSAFRAADPAKQFKGAIASYEELRRRFKPTAFDLLSLGDAQLGLAESEGSRPDEALVLLEHAVSRDPFNASLRLFVAGEYDRLGYPDRALAQRLTVYCWHIACP